jgi:hypothetical protein
MAGIRSVALVITGLVFVSGSAFADDRRSVEFILPGCRYEALRPAPVQDSEWSQAFICRDALATIIKDGPIQPAFLASCVPEGTPIREIARAVVEFLERDNNRYHERFDIRAASALHSMWPCH